MTADQTQIAQRGDRSLKLGRGDVVGLAGVGTPLFDEIVDRRGRVRGEHPCGEAAEDVRVLGDRVEHQQLVVDGGDEQSQWRTALVR
ncbi:MAG: hypothetical protein V9F03_05505 [Microthrixaceae bacterium]